VRVGGRYRMDEGEIVVDAVEPIGFPDITPALARESGFLGVVDLLKVAKHGRGERVYLVRFHYVGGGAEGWRTKALIVRLGQLLGQQGASGLERVTRDLWGVFAENIATFGFRNQVSEVIQLGAQFRPAFGCESGGRF